MILKFITVTWPVRLHTGTGHCFYIPAYPEQPHNSPLRHALRLHSDAAAQPDTPPCQWSPEPLPPRVGPSGSQQSAPERRSGRGLLLGAASDRGRSRSHGGTERWSTASLVTKMIQQFNITQTDFRFVACYLSQTSWDKVNKGL